MSRLFIGSDDVSGIKLDPTSSKTNPYVLDSVPNGLFVDYAADNKFNINGPATDKSGGFLPDVFAPNADWPHPVFGDGSVKDMFVLNNDLVSGTKASGFKYIYVNCWTDPGKTFAFCEFEMELNAAKSQANVQCITNFTVDGKKLLYHTTGPAWTWPGHCSTGCLLEQNKTIWFLDSTVANGYLKSGDSIRGWLFGPLVS